MAKAAAAIAKMATKHANVTKGVACAGTSLESVTYNVNKKAFLFVRAAAGELRLKRKAGWTKVSFADGKVPAELDAWIAESYALMAPKRK